MTEKCSAAIILLLCKCHDALCDHNLPIFLRRSDTIKVVPPQIEPRDVIPGHLSSLHPHLMHDWGTSRPYVIYNSHWPHTENSHSEADKVGLVADVVGRLMWIRFEKRCFISLFSSSELKKLVFVTEMMNFSATGWRCAQSDVTTFLGKTGDFCTLSHNNNNCLTKNIDQIISGGFFCSLCHNVYVFSFHFDDLFRFWFCLTNSIMLTIWHVSDRSAQNRFCLIISYSKHAFHWPDITF